MQETNYGVLDWLNLVLLIALMLVALLAPLFPFGFLAWVVRCRPDLADAYWRHPWLNSIALSFLLAGARVTFLHGLYLLSRVSSAALYPAAYAPFPELLTGTYLSRFGWNVDPLPNDSLVRYYGIIFGINGAFWLGLLLLAALGVSLSTLLRRA